MGQCVMMRAGSYDEGRIRWATVPYARDEGRI